MTLCNETTNLRSVLPKLVSNVTKLMTAYGSDYWGVQRHRVASSFRHLFILRRNLTEFRKFTNQTFKEVHRRLAGINTGDRRLENMLNITYKMGLGYRRVPSEIITGLHLYLTLLIPACLYLYLPTAKP